MHTPTPEQFQMAIDTLEDVLPMAQLEGHLDMEEHRVNYCDESEDMYPCGTTHCIGGWYAIANNYHKESLCWFGDGADRMARDLGFTDNVWLCNWAQNNPEIWGNRDGGSMFVDSYTWGGAKTLADCIKHLEGVRDRLAAASVTT